jgi:hypothetical protein
VVRTHHALTPTMVMTGDAGVLASTHGRVMTRTQAGPPPDTTTAERLAARFGAVFEALEAESDLFTRDAFFDLNMPVWRFQIIGGDAFTAHLRKIAKGTPRLRVLRTVPTASGFVTEHEERQELDGRTYSARRLWLCAVRDGSIAEAVGYCSGEWDDELRARHALEAPMVRS